MPSSRSIPRHLFCGAVLLILAAPLLAQTFVIGDLIVTGSGPGTSPQTFNWKVLWFDANGALKGTLYDQSQASSVSESAFGPGSALYAIIDRQIFRVAPDGTATALPTTGFTPRFLTVAADGRLYFSNLIVDTHIVGALSITHQPAGSFDVGDDAGSVDLAADQCTLYYHSNAPAQVSRFNVCAGVPLSPFSAPESGVTYGMLRILPDGVLQSHIGGGGVVRRNAAGQVVQSYPSWGFALALDPDRRSFWSVQGGSLGPSLFKVDLATGTVVRGPLPMLPNLTSVFSIAVVGEPRAAIAAANVADIPALSTLVLILLVSAMSVVALLRLR